MTNIDTQHPGSEPAFAALQSAIAGNIARRVHGNNDVLSNVPGLMLFRRDIPAPPTSCLVETSLVLAVQGEKEILVEGARFPYNAHRFLVTSMDIPATSQVLKASPDKPCLGFAYRLDLRIIAELMAAEGLSVAGTGGDYHGRGIGLGRVTVDLLDPFRRLLELLDEPESIPVLAPLIEREIHYRLLHSDQRTRLQQIASVGSQGHRVSKAIGWLRIHYRTTLRVEDLAAHVQMSPSSLYQHFRQFTAMSPLKYQKWLRLSEARRLMFTEGLNAASAAFQVGYESPSQFSREYSQLFGTPPRRDIERLRQQFSGEAFE